MTIKPQEPSVKERVAAVIKGDADAGVPFIDRMELWYRCHADSATMPAVYQGKSLNEIHRRVGLGRQMFVMPVSLKLNQVEMAVFHNGNLILRETDPVYCEFPANNAPAFIPRGQAGDTEIIFTTPKGKLRLKFTISASMAENRGAEPYLCEHLIKDDPDFHTVEYILERSEIVPQFDQIAAAEAAVGDNGFVVPRVHRIPFQQALLEYMGEIPLFYALYDNRRRLERLIQLLDAQVTEMIGLYRDCGVLLVQCPDNLDGFMTNPDLFKKYCLPYYQKYADLLHAQDKKLCSHVDGNLKPLCELLPESGLDIYESFSPWPLTDLKFEDAWQTWSPCGLIWGGIPSPILEPNVDQDQFEKHVDDFITTIRGQPIIAGIGDQVMPRSKISRVIYIAEQIAKL